jgi:hypothetical protein
MLRSALVLCAVAAAGVSAGFAQATVHVSPPEVTGARPLQEQTATAAVRNYLEAWESLETALGQNRVDVLDRDFVGTAKDKLSDTVQQQGADGIRTNYQDLVHNIKIVFYSPEGLSLELTDDVEYEVQILDHDKSVATKKMKARYLVVMTPAETRWRVRVLQAVTD